MERYLAHKSAKRLQFINHICHNPYTMDPCIHVDGFHNSGLQIKNDEGLQPSRHLGNSPNFPPFSIRSFRLLVDIVFFFCNLVYI